MLERNDWQCALRQGLRDVPSPPVSADFDARVLDALTQPQPWGRALWEQMRPLLTGAACSLVVTLLLVSWSQRLPTMAPPPAPQRPIAARPLDMTVIDRLLDRPHLSAASLAAWAALPPAPADRPRLPQRPSEHAAEPHCRASRMA